MNGSVHEDWIDPICTIVDHTQGMVDRFVASFTMPQAHPGYATWYFVAAHLSALLGLREPEGFDPDTFDQDVIATLDVAVTRGLIVRLGVGADEQFERAHADGS